MISLFGVVSFIVLSLCCTGLALHYHVIKKRARVDNASRVTEETKDPAEYEAALADYNGCIARFPFNIIAKILNLPPELNE
jgi:hypothetical protein